MEMLAIYHDGTSKDVYKIVTAENAWIYAYERVHNRVKNVGFLKGQGSLAIYQDCL